MVVEAPAEAPAAPTADAEAARIRGLVIGSDDPEPDNDELEDGQPAATEAAPTPGNPSSAPEGGEPADGAQKAGGDGEGDEQPPPQEGQPAQPAGDGQPHSTLWRPSGGRAGG